MSKIAPQTSPQWLPCYLIVVDTNVVSALVYENIGPIKTRIITAPPATDLVDLLFMLRRRIGCCLALLCCVREFDIAGPQVWDALPAPYHGLRLVVGRRPRALIVRWRSAASSPAPSATRGCSWRGPHRDFWFEARAARRTHGRPPHDLRPEKYLNERVFR